MKLVCIACKAQYSPDDLRYLCQCGSLLEVLHPEFALTPDLADARLSSRLPCDRSGVWRFREVILATPENDILTHPEGGTPLYQRKALQDFAGVDSLYFKHEGENPTGSFKDRGMTVALTQAKRLGMEAAVCASTGNTSASLAAYAAHAGMKALVLIPDGKIAAGKLMQAVGYGAIVVAIDGDFDQAMELVQEASQKLGLYLVNSLNPFRLEGQKTIVWELLQDLSWQAPDWIVVPAGNLGNTSAFGKALREASAAGWIDAMPRIASVQAAGANPFFRSYCEGFAKKFTVQAETVATAIRIGNPVNHDKAVSTITSTQGTVIEVNDQEIMQAKQIIDRCGIGCEPASAASLAGIKKMREMGNIAEGDSVVGILTGHMLKDPDSVMSTFPSKITTIPPTLTALEKVVSSHSQR